MTKRDIVKEIRRSTRRKFTAEEKIRIVLEGLRGDIPISELARCEGMAPSVYYRWSKAFLEAGKNGLTRDTRRDATSAGTFPIFRHLSGTGKGWPGRSKAMSLFPSSSSGTGCNHTLFL